MKSKVTESSGGIAYFYMQGVHIVGFYYEHYASNFCVVFD